MKRLRVLAVIVGVLFASLVVIDPRDAVAALTKYVLGLNYGLIGYWTFDGQDTNWATGRTNDLSVGGNTGTVRGMSTTTGTSLGKLGQGFNFDGVDDQVVISGSQVYLNSGSPFTFSAWVNLARFQTANTSYPKIVVLRTDTTNAFEISFSNDTNYQGLLFGSGADWANSKTDTASASLIAKWIHVVVTYNGAGATTRSNFKAYLDTTSQTLTAPGAFTAFSQQSLIGGIASGDDEFWIGAIDDVRVYDREFSVTEVKQLYNLGQDKLGVSSSNKALAINKDLASYWTFDGKDTNWATGRVTDVSGNGNTGTVAGMSTATVPVLGKSGQAFNFDGVNDYVAIGDTLDSLTVPFSVSFWVNARSFVSGASVIASDKLGNSAHSGFWVDAESTGQIFISYGDNTACNGGGRRTGNSGSNLSINRWQHVVGIVRGATDMSFYVDGVDVGISYDGTGGAMVNTANTGSIGGDYNCGSPAYFNGSLDDLRVYSRALTAVEVKQLYNLGQNKFSVSPTSKATSLNQGFVGYWTFDGKDVNWATGAVTDVSGNGNTGGVVGMSTTTNPVLGKIGQGMNFDGADDRMQVSSSGVNGLTAMTACAWVKPASASADYPVIFSTYDATAGWDIYLIDQGTTYGLGTSAKGGVSTGYKEVTTSTITEGSWSHICTEQNGDTAANMKLFMNGRDVGSSATSDIGGGRADDADNDAFVGQMYDSSTGSRYRGSIDDLRVYSRVLTATEIAQLYKLGQGKTR